MTNKELADEIKENALKMECYMDKIMESQKDVSGEIVKLRLCNESHNGRMKAIEIIQDKQTISQDKIQREIVPLVFMNSNPNLVKFMAVGFICVLLFSIFAGFNTVNTFYRDDENIKIEQFQPREPK